MDNFFNLQSDKIFLLYNSVYKNWVRVHFEDFFLQKQPFIQLSSFHCYHNWSARKLLLNCAQSFRKLIKAIASSVWDSNWRSAEDQHVPTVQKQRTALSQLLAQMFLWAHPFVPSHKVNYETRLKMAGVNPEAWNTDNQVKIEVLVSFSQKGEQGLAKQSVRTGKLIQVAVWQRIIKLKNSQKVTQAGNSETLQQRQTRHRMSKYLFILAHLPVSELNWTFRRVSFFGQRDLFFWSHTPTACYWPIPSLILFHLVLLQNMVH